MKEVTRIPQTRKLFVLLFVLLVGPGLLPAQNLVVNGSFDSDITGWATLADPSNIQFFLKSDVGSTLDGGSGPASLEIQRYVHNGGSSGCYQDIPVTAGVEYLAEGSVMLPTYSPNVATGAMLNVEWFNEGGGSLRNDWSSDAGLGFDAWLRESGSFVAPADAVTARVFLMISSPYGDTETDPGIALWDDILFQEAGTTVARQILFVPAAASVAGAGGTFWSTTGWFSNDTGFPMDLKGAFLARDQDNSQALEALYAIGTIPAHGFLEVADLAARVGGSGQGGGIYIEATAQAAGLPATLIHGTTYTFTPNPNGSGAYGQGLPTVGPGEKNAVTIPGIFQGTDYRTNIGVLNTSAASLDLSVEIRGRDGSILADVAWSLPPYAEKQVSLTSMGITEASGGFVVLKRTGSLGSFRAFSSVVDQHTGDAVYTPGL